MTDPKDVTFGRSVKVQTADGAFDGKMFKKECLKCNIIYHYDKHESQNIIQYIAETYYRTCS